MKKIYLLGAFVALISVSAFLFSFKKATPNNKLVAGYNSKDLFVGIFFGKGQIAELLPETQHIFGAVQKPSLNNSPQMSFVQQVIVNDIEKRHPGMLAMFKSKIESGNRLVIQQTLSETSIEIAEILTQNPEIIALKKRNLLSKSNGQNSDVIYQVNSTMTDTQCIYGPCSIAIDGSAVFIVLQSGQNGKSANFARPSLIEENLINSIANNLSK